MTQRKVNDVDTYHLCHILVRLAFLDIFGDKLRDAVEHAVEVAVLALVLYFDKEFLAEIVLGEDIHAVELIVTAFLIPLALKYRHDFNLPTEQACEETLEHYIARLVAQEAFHGPVESDKSRLTIFVEKISVVYHNTEN